MFCPKCKCEYSENIEECPCCHMKLVKKLTKENKNSETNIKIVTAFSSMNLVDIARVKYILEEENINYFTKEQGMGSLYGAGNLVFGTVQIQVREEDVEKVETVLKEFMAD